ncbi:MAG: efflux RND transporter periplasmic adaptor subunit [Pseudomonadota bacterium]
MNLKALLILPPLILAGFGYAWMTSPQDAVAQTADEARLAVRVNTVQEAPLVVSVRGFGRVEPVRSWSAVSQVDGRVTETVDDLAVGTIVDAGALLVQIDTTDYELTVQKSEANIAAAEATLVELDGQEENSNRLLEIEQRVLEVTQDEFERTQDLFDQGTASASSLDSSQKSLLAQENSVVNLTNTVALYPSQRKSAEATLAVRQAELAEAERALSNTTITTPFRGRVSSEAVQVGQFVRVGEQLATIDAINVVEVVGAFQPQNFSGVISAALDGQFDDVAEIEATRVIEFLRRGGVEAYVELDFAGVFARYPAELMRFNGVIDDSTGTIGIAVHVKDPLLVNGQGDRPPLQTGAFVSVVLQGVTPDQSISIPRAAVQQADDGTPYVYTATNEDRLGIAPITVGPVAGDQIMITEGLVAGDRVVLSSPRPPIEGLALTPVEETVAVQ